MKDIICSAVRDVFDEDALKDAISEVVSELIDYEEVADALLCRDDLRELVTDAAISVAEDLL